MRKKIKLFLSIFIVLITFYVFINYLRNNSYILKRLSHIDPVLIVLILLLYLVILLILVTIMKASLDFYKIKVPNFDNLLLNSYSLVINFFMFGQAGPGVRAIYLKKKYQLPIKRFIFITLIYYGLYTLLSSLLILIGSKLMWYYSLLIIVGVILISILVIKWFLKTKLNNKNLADFKLSGFIKLGLVTLAQLLIQTLIYGIELDSIKHVYLHQILAYSGFANLSLFVSITPAGIGIREAFLILSESIHHISSSQIVSASIIDRSVYLIFLLGIILFLAIFHAGKKLKNMTKI